MDMIEEISLLLKGGWVEVTITFQSLYGVTARTRMRSMRCSLTEFEQGFLAWWAGTPVDDSFPFLSASERSFLMHGNLL